MERRIGIDWRCIILEGRSWREVEVKKESREGGDGYWERVYRLDLKDSIGIGRKYWMVVPLGG